MGVEVVWGMFHMVVGTLEEGLDHIRCHSCEYKGMSDQFTHL
jgi:hypothetical protein